MMRIFTQPSTEMTFTELIHWLFYTGKIDRADRDHWLASCQVGLGGCVAGVVKAKFPNEWRQLTEKL